MRSLATVMSRSLLDVTSERLAALCDSAGFQGKTARVLDLYRELLAPWGGRRLDEPGGWKSEISDDNTPVEFSAALAGKRAEIRVLFEPLGEEPHVRSFRRASLRFHDRLARDYHADLSRFRAIEDLFLPETMEGPFAAWSSVVFSPSEAPTFKTYLNPQARGRGRAESLVENALERLGMTRAFSIFRETRLRRGPKLDELKYFALDLTSTADARVKLYVRHHAATPRDLEAACRPARTYVANEALDFVREMCGGDMPLMARAPFTCTAFTSEDSDHHPVSTTVYVPICAYCRDDAAVTERIKSYMRSSAVDPTLYERIIHGYTNRPLGNGVGMQSWFALRRHGGEAKLTVYLATEANYVHAPGTVPAPSAFADDGGPEMMACRRSG